MAGLVMYRRRMKRVEAHGSQEEKEDASFSIHRSHNPKAQQVHAQGLLPQDETKQKPQQVFLDLGQSDFSHTACKICGFLYARGYDEDEKLHSLFHANCVRGIPFKGWQKERVIMEHDKNNERVILVMHSDPLPHHVKVKEVTKIMEKELQLEPGWLLLSWCKVYLYISSLKVVGCIVVEPIRLANLLLPQQPEVRRPEDNQHKVGVSQFAVRETKNNSSTKTLAFGNVTFKREVIQKRSKFSESMLPAATDIFSDVAVPAVCGIRGLWVSRKERRQGIATRLLDAMRSSFIYGLVVDSSQCAFLQPTSDGRAFAQKYCKTDKFLVYSQ